MTGILQITNINLNKIVMLYKINPFIKLLKYKTNDLLY